MIHNKIILLFVTSICCLDLSSIMKGNISSLPIHPSPKPRKFSTIEKPQPVPRTIPHLKTGGNFDVSIEDNCSIITPDTTSDLRPNFPVSGT